MSFNTPILFIVFNRPIVTQLVFSEIKKIKPAQLFISADGAREAIPQEKIYCDQVKQIVSEIDWPCEVHHKYNSKNLGCGQAVSSAISWFFEHVEQGIILEDDCLPHPSFFNYCSELLNYYKDNEKVMHIGGVNFQNEKRGIEDYYFSAVTHVWGWATWRRAWNLYSFHLEGFDKFKRESVLNNYFNNASLKHFVLENFNLMENHVIDTWDHQWTYTIYKNNGVSIIPNYNLISNIGFISNATHTFDENNKQANKSLESVALPLKHPRTIVINNIADEYFYFNVVQIPKIDGIRPLLKKGIAYIKSKIIKAIDYLLDNLYFKNKNGNSTTILVVKPDAIGDYIMFRNLMEAVILNKKNEKYNFYLLANSRLKTFIYEVDRHLYKDVIYYEEGITNRYKSYIRFCFTIKKIKAHKVIYSVFSRRELFDDFISKSGATYKISPESDSANQSKESLQKTNSTYTSIIKPRVQNIHEFERYKYFLEDCFEEKIEINKPELKKSDVKNSIQNNRIIICPGSNEKYKIWSPENFAQLINLIKEQFPQYIIDIVCGPNEEYLGQLIQANTKQVNKQINVTSIVSLCQEIENSKMVISNDSAPIHIAVAYSIPNICIFNGSRYGRFVPYPESISESSSVVIPSTLVSTLNSSTKEYFYQNLTKMDINEVTVNSVFNEVSKCISKIDKPQ